MTDQFDVVVLGGGPGGYPAAVRAAQLGRRVAIVEGEQIGGMCLHRGCIPTKALLHVAETLRALRDCATLGIDVSTPRLDVGRMAGYRNSVIHRLHGGVQRLLRQHDITVIKGWGHLVGPSSLEVVDEDARPIAQVSGGDLILATGSRPRSLRGLAFDGSTILSSDHAATLDVLPESIIIVGAGAVGVEFASFYTDAGVAAVTLVEMLPRILPMEDAEVSSEVERQLKVRGVRILTGASVRSESVVIGRGQLVCTVDSPDGPEQLHASMMLVAAGREAITQDLGLEDLGVAFDGGFVRVDGWMRTNVPHLYAVGDVAGEPLLAHKATAEGRLAAEVIAGQAETPLRYDLIPRCTYSYPEVGSFGLSEEAAIAGGYSVAVGRFPLAANSRSAIEHERGGFVKFVMESGTEQILGLHAVGPTVCELIAGGVIAGNLDSTPLEIARSIHPHPTISEAFAEAAAALYGMATHA